MTSGVVAELHYFDGLFPVVRLRDNIMVLISQGITREQNVVTLPLIMYAVILLSVVG